MKGIASGAVIVAVTVTPLAGAATAAPAEEKQIQEKVWTLTE